MHDTVIGLDIAKSIFHSYEVSTSSGEVKKKVIKRNRMLDYFANKSKSLIGIEACGGSNYWARELSALGHEVKIIAPQFVKPFVTGNKNDIIDAAAIYEALCRPSMRFVPGKNLAQQDQQMVHRIRERLVKARTALSNEIRGLLLEYGIAIHKGHKQIREEFLCILDKYQGKLSEMAIELFKNLREEFLALDNKIKAQEKRLKGFCKSNDRAKQLLSIPGVGVMTASALASSIGNANNFECSKQLSAWLGLVPRQYSSGGKTVLKGISKRGDKYLRKLLIHGARSTLQTASRKAVEKRTPLEKWAVLKHATIGHNKTCAALANKMARIAWALLRKEEYYCEQLVCTR